MKSLSQQPYLLRALHEWCVDAGYTPYIVATVDQSTRVPPGFARNGEITLNLSPEAVQGLLIDNEWVSFTARFGGVAQQIDVPMVNVQAIYARETGEGMSFASMMDETVAESPLENPENGTSDSESVSDEIPPPPKGKPNLRLVK